LLQAMRSDTSETGTRFNSERESLFRRSERLLHVLAYHHVRGWGGPPSSLDRINDWLKAAEAGFPIHYPKPRHLTSEEHSLLQYRENAATEALQGLYAELRPRLESQDNEARTIWQEACTSWNQWVNKVRLEANPRLKTRVSKHLAVRQYRREIENFCRRWQLEAWWAVPAMVQSHLFRIETGNDGLLECYLVGVWPVTTFRIVVKLPGASDEKFGRDGQQFSGAMVETEIESWSSYPNVIVRRRPSRAEMASFEGVQEAGCVVIDWDGSPTYSSRHHGSPIRVTEYVVEECEERLGRTLRKSERRSLLGQIDPQITDVRHLFMESGFTVEGRAELEQHALWVAQRLLNPRRAWHDIFQIPYPHEQRAPLRASREFAARAGVRLPATRKPATFSQPA
jgi:hypothetical protein